MMTPYIPESGAAERAQHTAKVLQLHTSPPACIAQDSRDVAELLSAQRKHALAGDLKGALLVVVDKDGQWHAHITGHLARNDLLQLSILGHLFGMAMRGPLAERIEG